jgi:hypothetical protein
MSNHIYCLSPNRLLDRSVYPMVRTILRAYFRATKVMKKILLMLLVAAYVTPMVGCKEKGPMEKAGEKIDRAAEKTGDKIDEAAKDTKRAVKDATNN